jgi:hypothetical protein
VNAQDYTWFNGTTLDHGYCLTLAQDLNPTEAIRRIDGEPQEQRTGLKDFVDFADRDFPWAGREDQRFAIGAIQLDGWVLLVEWNGFLGVTTEVIRPLSAGTRSCRTTRMSTARADSAGRRTVSCG